MTVISKDIIELKMTEEKLPNLSNTDELPGLFNARFFLPWRQQLKISARTKKGILLLLADLDDLKKINDTFGHREGDRALVETAGILRECFRNVDIIARMGGDEFVVLLIDAALDKLDMYITRLRQKLGRYNQI